MALKAKKPPCGGAERGLRMNMNELIIWGLPGLSENVLPLVPMNSNGLSFSPPTLQRQNSGLSLDADAPLGAMARSCEASSAPLRFLGQWDAHGMPSKT